MFDDLAPTRASVFVTSQASSHMAEKGDRL